MARTFTKPNVGTSGRRRIVPMMGIDFIAGNIENKKGPVRNEYGVKPASMGGRTRSWSFINFLQVNPSGKRTVNYDEEATRLRAQFSTAVKSSRATTMDLTVLPRVQADFKNAIVYGGIDPNNYATLRGWISSIRYAQISAGVAVTDTYTVWPPVFS